MKVSLITPCYNAEKTIEKTIKSVLSQGYNNIEYIIVDGNSSDKTIDIIKKYENQIYKWISEPDKGISDAYNKGIKMASGELIGIIASDDEILIDAVERMVNAYDGKSDVVSGSVIERGSLGYKIIPSNSDTRLLEIRTSLKHPATYIRKDAYEKYGVYSLDYKCAMDRELFLRFYKLGASFQVIEEPLTLFNRGGISTDNPCKVAYVEDEKIAIKYGISKVKARCCRCKSCLKFYAAVSGKFFLKKTGLMRVYEEKNKGKYLSDIVLERYLEKNDEDN